MRGFFPVVFLCLALPLCAYAQQPPKLEPLPEGPGDEAPIIIKHKAAEGEVENYYHDGRLYMVKVTPRSGVAYYLIDDRGDGIFSRQDHLDSGVRPPMWVLHQF